VLYEEMLNQVSLEIIFFGSVAEEWYGRAWLLLFRFSLLKAVP
jgi:hypothetical protein